MQFGHGPKKVLGWSQMHGNESTTTKAVFDFISFMQLNDVYPSEIEKLESQFTFYFIPMLNPDGALLYTRENFNKIDLNRDAQDQSQVESRILKSVFQEFEPNVCLNLHDQRTIYGLSTGKSATVSFLSPSADPERTITPSREVAMDLIAGMNSVLQKFIPGHVGRYDDGFNINCVGDTFQNAGVPTVLFEAGHYPGDYDREKTREYIFYALLALFGAIPCDTFGTAIEGYFAIPENNKDYRDILLKQAKIGGELVDVAIQYKEELENGLLKFVPYVDAIGSLREIKGHREVELNGEDILINSHENVFVDEKILTISTKSLEKILKI